MAETAPQQDALEQQRNNPEVMAIIMELYGVREEVAAELWNRFIGTVRKMKAIVDEQK